MKVPPLPTNAITAGKVPVAIKYVLCIVKMDMISIYADA